jgi:hypothetical protein
MYRVSEVKKTIAEIEAKDASPIHRARQLLMLHHELEQYSQANSGQGFSGADSRALKEAQEEARLAALRVMRARPLALGFHLRPVSTHSMTPRGRKTYPASHITLA